MTFTAAENRIRRAHVPEDCEDFMKLHLRTMIAICTTLTQGMTGYEPCVWAANFILDNLIADGKDVPMIVVMPNGHIDPTPPNSGGRGNGGADSLPARV